MHFVGLEHGLLAKYNNLIQDVVVSTVSAKM